MKEEYIKFIADYTKTDSLFLGRCLDELYNSEYCVIGFYIANSGVHFEEAKFINDLEDSDYSDQSSIFLVSEICDSYKEIKELL